MVQVDLPRTFIHHVPDGAFVSAATRPQPTRDTAIEGQVEVFAEARVRPVSLEGELAQFAFGLLLVPHVDLVTLESWKGHMVLVRERFGQAFYGSYFKVSAVPIRGRPGKYTVAITLDRATYTEGV
jgi:hypothetical protein